MEVETETKSTTSNAMEVDEASNAPETENMIYNLWTFGDMNLLVRWHADGYMSEAEKVSPNLQGFQSIFPYSKI
jgi:hypothetical protein